MPVANDRKYKTVSVVVTLEQARRIDSLRQLRSSHLREASFSEAAREIIDAGLEELFRAPGSTLTTTTQTAEAAA